MSFKPSLYIFFYCFFFFSFSSCKTSNQIKENKLKVYFNHSLNNPYDYKKSESSQTTDLVLAKGESESFQIALELETTDYLEFNKKSSNKSLNFEISEIVEYNGALDLLVPIDENKYLPKQKTVFLWVTYYANRKIKPGRYTDYLNIKTTNGLKTLTFTIEVKDITIPITPSIPLTFGIYDAALTSSNKKNDIIKKRKQYFELCFKNRLSPYLVNWGPPHRHLHIQSSPYEWSDPRTKNYIKDPRFAAIGLPFYDYTDEELKELYSRVEQAGLVNKAYVYFYDEPRNYEDHEKVLDYVKKLSNIAPSLKIQLPIFCGMTEESDDIFEVFDYYKDYPVIVNTGFYPLQSNEERAKQCLEKVYPKQEWWTYTCCGAKPGFTYNTSAFGTRSILWRSFKEQSKGFLYWAVNNYESIDPDVIPEWTKPGDGHLIYRGEEFGKNYPLSTLRLERFRDSEEDYELLKMIEEKYNRQKALELLSTVYTKPNISTNNAETVDAFRLKMLKILDQ
ncbi:DUF4091 domain-containing protein [Aestuariibaculum marinum]|uniref:DUF4091 domain-containing protein n=1 Tax=Aestuariibaculum marinum TaxID=2683592 RepID=A0A8J6PRX9_9FLAO|nr:DUF4091 domain-containing protein [Aestuariibaculum marinum]MBD0822503.1 DUF4091 domain-containing protein [Aestuariibaculum marinum]